MFHFSKICFMFFFRRMYLKHIYSFLFISEREHFYN